MRAESTSRSSSAKKVTDSSAKKRTTRKAPATTKTGRLRASKVRVIKNEKD